MHIDDIVTSQNLRSRGYGDTLYKWLRVEAKIQDASLFISPQQCIEEIHIDFILDRAWLFQASTSGKKLMTYNKKLTFNQPQPKLFEASK